MQGRMAAVRRREDPRRRPRRSLVLAGESGPVLLGLPPLLVLFPLLLLLAPTPALASPWPQIGLRLAPEGETPAPEASTSPEERLKAAQEAYQEGSQAYALGHFAEAVVAFERSYSLSQRPELLYNIGQSYAEWYAQSDDTSHLRKARTLFHNYVKFLQGEGREQAEIDEAEAAVAEVEALLAEASAAQAPVVGPVEEPEPEPEPEPVTEPASGQGSATADEPEKRPLVRRGWFWGVLIGGAIVIAGGVTAGVLLSREPGINPELGTIRGHSAPMEQGALLRF